MTRTAANPTLVCQLIRKLQALQVSLPDEIQASAEQLLRIPGMIPVAEAPRTSLIGLTDAELVAILREVGLTAALNGQDHGRHAFHEINRAMAADLADALAELADEVLDQLRPAFTDAAAITHQATELGLHPHATDRDILQTEDVVAARDLWAALPAATRTLEAIAEARIDLSVATGVPPALERAGIDSQPNYLQRSDLASQMFHADPKAWHLDGEDGWQRWLRLSLGVAPQLLPIGATL